MQSNHTTVAAVPHPLHPLTANEINAVTELLRTEKNLGYHTTRFVSITLKPLPKSFIYDYTEGQPFDREAFVVVLDSSTGLTYEAVVSITQKKLLSWVHIPGVQPTMTADEQIECEEVVKKDPAFHAAIKKYGITDPDLVMVDIWTAGNYGAEEEKTTRLARPLCFVRADATDNGYAHPIEGVRPVVDLNKMEVIRVEEFDVAPIPWGTSNYRRDKRTSFRNDIAPLDIVQPAGPGFSVKGYEVNWQNWNFHISFESREGLTLNYITYKDGEAVRPILYRASLSEMVVPYGDPGPTQNKKNAFDTGEYGMGQCANSLELGCDCVGYIKYFDGVLNNSRGEAFVIKNAICMHEEDYGILWKHTDRRDGQPEVRRSRRLVVSSVSTVENYEYGFFWYLYQDGNIQFEIKLTGILSLGAVAEGVKPKYGNLVAPQVYAPNHQHFFNMRLDFDIDGMSNSAYEINIVPDEINENNPYENAFYAKASLLDTELNARRNMSLESGRTWKIVNPSRKNKLGEPAGYKLLPGDNCVPYASKNASWYKRAGFVQNHFWVTPFSATENYGAGDYPNQHIGGEGLIKWTEANRSIIDTDIVVWYTMGHTHIPRPEDYPVMPTGYIGFLLKPNGFFDENPANDLPPSQKVISADKKSCCSSEGKNP